MLREVLYAKIHQAVVTRCNPEYVGSVTIDARLLEATGLAPNEKVLIADCENGNRFESYVFYGEPGSGAIEVNGAAARQTAVGHRVLIMSFAQMTPEEMARHRPKVVVCDEHNGIAELIRYMPGTLLAERPQV
ncbi:MAG: aspartate 1-decarboxylase [Planctomycetota bacterium]|jgi:aspartate 1-decarboxylase